MNSPTLFQRSILLTFCTVHLHSQTKNQLQAIIRIKVPYDYCNFAVQSARRRFRKVHDQWDAIYQRSMLRWPEQLEQCSHNFPRNYQDFHQIPRELLQLILHDKST